jgi:hypothetical protein
MEATYWSMIVLVVDAIGALLLSAEAIKLPNIRAARDRFWKPLRFTLLMMATSGAGGRVEVPRKQTWSYVIIFASLTLVWSRVLAHSTGIGPADDFWKTVAIYLGSALLGGLTFTSLIVIAHMAIKALDFIDQRTEDGGVGIIGLGLLLAGFALQFLGTFLSL